MFFFRRDAVVRRDVACDDLGKVVDQAHLYQLERVEVLPVTQCHSHKRHAERMLGDGFRGRYALSSPPGTNERLELTGLTEEMKERKDIFQGRCALCLVLGAW